MAFAPIGQLENFSAPVSGVQWQAADAHPGLTATPRDRWPRVAVQPNQRPIDMMKPGNELHNRVLN